MPEQTAPPVAPLTRRERLALRLNRVTSRAAGAAGLAAIGATAAGVWGLAGPWWSLLSTVPYLVAIDRSSP